MKHRDLDWKNVPEETEYDHQPYSEDRIHRLLLTGCNRCLSEKLYQQIPVVRLVGTSAEALADYLRSLKSLLIHCRQGFCRQLSCLSPAHICELFCRASECTYLCCLTSETTNSAI